MFNTEWSETTDWTGFVCLIVIRSRTIIIMKNSSQRTVVYWKFYYTNHWFVFTTERHLSNDIRHGRYSWAFSFLPITANWPVRSFQLSKKKKERETDIVWFSHIFFILHNILFLGKSCHKHQLHQQIPAFFQVISMEMEIIKQLSRRWVQWQCHLHPSILLNHRHHHHLLRW